MPRSHATHSYSNGMQNGPAPVDMIFPSSFSQIALLESEFQNVRHGCLNIEPQHIPFANIEDYMHNAQCLLSNTLSFVIWCKSFFNKKIK